MTARTLAMLSLVIAGTACVPRPSGAVVEAPGPRPPPRAPAPAPAQPRPAGSWTYAVPNLASVVAHTATGAVVADVADPARLPVELTQDTLGAVHVVHSPPAASYGSRIIDLAGGDRLRIAPHAECGNIDDAVLSIGGAFHTCATLIYRESPARSLRWSTVFHGEWTELKQVVPLASGDLAIAGMFKEDAVVDGHTLRASYFGGFVAVLDGGTGRVQWIAQPSSHAAVAIAASADALWVALLAHGKETRTQVVRYGLDGARRAAWKMLPGQVGYLRPEADGTVTMVRIHGDEPAVADVEHRSATGALLRTHTLARGQDAEQLEPERMRWVARAYTERVLALGDASCGEPTWRDGLRWPHAGPQPRYCRVRPDGSRITIQVANGAAVEQLDDAMLVPVAYQGHFVLYRFADDAPPPPPFVPDVEAARRYAQERRDCPPGWKATRTPRALSCRYELGEHRADVTFERAPAYPAEWTRFRCAPGEPETVHAELGYRACGTGDARRTEIAVYPDGRLRSFTEREGGELVSRGWHHDGKLRSEVRRAIGAATYRPNLVREYDERGTLIKERRGPVPDTEQRWSSTGALVERSRSTDEVTEREVFFPDGSLRASWRTRADGAPDHTRMYAPGRPREVCTPTTKGGASCVQHFPDGRERGRMVRDARGRWSRVSGKPALPRE